MSTHASQAYCSFPIVHISYTCCTQFPNCRIGVRVRAKVRFRVRVMVRVEIVQTGQ